jgi:hypothetical protein
MIISLVLLGIGIAAYSISQLLEHQKFKWMTSDYTFWGGRGYLRKYKFPLESHKGNWYYRLFKIKYKERWPTSATFTVMFTDSYHAFQSISFLSFAGAFSLMSGIHFLYVWAGILLIHFTVYRLLQK